MQNLLAQLEYIVKEGAVCSASGDGKIPYVDLRDVAAVALVTLTQLGHLGKTYVVTGSEALSYREAAAIISAEIGKPLCFIDGTQDEARKRRIREGLPAAVIESALAISACQCAGGKTVTITTTVADLTGRAPPNIRRIRSRKCCGLPWLDTGVVALSDDRRSRDPAGVVGC